MRRKCEECGGWGYVTKKRTVRVRSMRSGKLVRLPDIQYVTCAAEGCEGRGWIAES